MVALGADGTEMMKILFQVKTKVFIFIIIFLEITRTRIADISNMAEMQQDRLWTSLEALYSAVLWAPDSIPTIETSFSETSFTEFNSEMEVKAKSSLAPEAVRFYSR